MNLPNMDSYEFVINRTRRFLFPILNLYGRQFNQARYGLHVIACGISDSGLRGVKFRNHLFILFSHITGDVKGAMEEMALNDNYVTHYSAYGGTMLVMQILPEYDKAMKSFLEGNYSEMYTKKQLVKIFPIKVRDKDSVFNVITKNRIYKKRFEDKLNASCKLNGSDIDHTRIEIPEGFELESRINPREEIF